MREKIYFANEKNEIKEKMVVMPEDADVRLSKEMELFEEHEFWSYNKEDVEDYVEKVRDFYTR